MRSKSYDFTIQTQVEKHYIHKDSEFYRVYIDMMKKVTKVYNIQKEVLGCKYQPIGIKDLSIVI